MAIVAHFPLLPTISIKASQQKSDDKNHTLRHITELFHSMSTCNAESSHHAHGLLFLRRDAGITTQLRKLIQIVKYKFVSENIHINKKNERKSRPFEPL